MRGYACHGTLKFVGIHHKKQSARVGVELDAPLGKNDGTISGHRYFEARESHGILTVPAKLTFYDELLTLDPVIAGSEECPGESFLNELHVHFAGEKSLSEISRELDASMLHMLPGESGERPLSDVPESPGSTYSGFGEFPASPLPVFHDLDPLEENAADDFGYSEDPVLYDVASPIVMGGGGDGGGGPSRTELTPYPDDGFEGLKSPEPFAGIPFAGILEDDGDTDDDDVDAALAADSSSSDSGNPAGGGGVAGSGAATVVKSVQEKLVTIVLNRQEGLGFGFAIGSVSVGDTADTHAVEEVSDGGPAAGLLAAGDMLLAINGVKMQSLPHEDVLEVVRAAQSLEIRIRRSVQVLQITVEVVRRSRGGCGFELKALSSGQKLVDNIVQGSTAAACLRGNDSVVQVNGTCRTGHR